MNNFINATNNHVFKVRTDSKITFKKADELKIGDFILGASYPNLGWVKIVNIESFELPYPRKVIKYL